MTDDMWTRPPPSRPSMPYSPSTGARPSSRQSLTAGERLLALEMTDEHHGDLHRQTARRLEVGEHRMDRMESGIDGLERREQERQAAKSARDAERAQNRAARNQAIQMAVWMMALATGAVTLWNVASPRAPVPPPAIYAPAPR